MAKKKLQMNEPLQVWANGNEPDKKLIYAGGFWEQIIFVRDVLERLLFGRLRGPLEPTRVISTHVSKSVKLPVCYMKLAGGLTLVMRNNFYDWKISVESPIPIEGVDFDGLFDPHDVECINPVFCEGMPKDLVFECSGRNKKQFTVKLGNDYQAYTFLWLLQRAFYRNKKK